MKTIDEWCEHFNVTLYDNPSGFDSRYMDMEYKKEEFLIGLKNSDHIRPTGFSQYSHDFPDRKALPTLGWSWRCGGGDWSAPLGSKEEAKDFLTEENLEILIGEAVPMEVPGIHAECILEDVQDTFFDGFHLFEGVSYEEVKKLDRKLNEVYMKWCRRNNITTDHFKVINIKEVIING